MAYVTFRSIENFQENFCQKFALSFVSKESNQTDWKLKDSDIIVATPNEICSQLSGENYQLRDDVVIIMDDADGYIKWQKISEMIEKLRTSVFIMTSSYGMPEISNILNQMQNETFHKQFEWIDHLNYVEIQPKTNVKLMDFKINVLNEMFETLSNVCPLGQALVFCYVSNFYPWIMISSLIIKN